VVGSRTRISHLQSTLFQRDFLIGMVFIYLWTGWARMRYPLWTVYLSDKVLVLSGKIALVSKGFVVGNETFFNVV
jgi:hypothetical protein